MTAFVLAALTTVFVGRYMVATAQSAYSYPPKTKKAR